MTKLLVFFVLFVSSLGDEASDKAQSFEEMTDELGKIRDSCFESTDVKVEDLKDYEKAEEASEKELCFYKCFYEQIGLMENGRVVTQNMNMISAFKGMNEDEIGEVEKCFDGMEEIKTCEDMRKVEECLL